MTSPLEPPFVPQVLLDHGQFVSSLARSLLRDAHAAEDVAQETWARYFEHQPSAERGLRNWLRTVTRNLVTNRARTEQSRAARERQAARSVVIEGGENALEQGELLRAVVEAVLALDEPYRETILARYWRGLDAAQVAAESGTSAGTVRSREKRALEQLRERLDRTTHGERAAWAGALARFTGPPATPQVSPSRAASSASVKIAAALALTVLAVVALRFLSPLRSNVGEHVASASSEPANPSSATTPLDDPRAPAGERTALAGRSTVRENASDDGLAELRGRLVFPRGGPAAGVPLKVEGWGANQELQLFYGVPDDWVDPVVTSDSDGRFSIRFDPPRAYQFALSAKAPGHAEVRWSWGEIAPGATLDLGEVELPVGGRIEGRIVDEQGQLVLGQGWSVSARTTGLGERDGRDDTQVYAEVDPSTGAFHLEHVWPGPLELEADTRMSDTIPGPRVAARTGQTVTADIVYAGPDLAHRIAVQTYWQPFYVIDDPEPEYVKLIAADGTVRKATGHLPLVFDSVEPGLYTVEIDDPRYVPWSRTGVAPGERVTARMVGASALRLSVTDREGHALERYAVRVNFRNTSFNPSEFAVHDGKEPLADGLLRGIFPGDYTIEVRAQDGSSASVEVDGLVAGETRALALQLEARGSVSGRVVYTDGGPAVGAQVFLLAPAARDDSETSPILIPDRGGIEEYCRKALVPATADEGGGFQLALPGPGVYLVLAERDGSRVCSESLTFTNRVDRDGLELVMPRSGSVRGRVAMPSGGAGMGLTLWIDPARLCTPIEGFDMKAMATWSWRTDELDESLRHAAVHLGADGRFELSSIPPGPSKVFLVLDAAIRNGYSSTSGGGRIDGSVELGDIDVPEGAVLERDFELKELPGKVTLDVRVNGAPAPGLEICLTSGAELGGMQIEGRTEGQGQFGPLSVLVGVWFVFASDSKAGWSFLSPTQVFVESGRESSVLIDIVVATGSLLCVDASGQPLANTDISVLPRYFLGGDPGVGWCSIAAHKTDANGRLELQLTPGEYGLLRGEYDPALESPATVPLSWTASGPLAERVQL